jgi:hypothetical protein
VRVRSGLLEVEAASPTKINIMMLMMVNVTMVMLMMARMLLTVFR